MLKQRIITALVLLAVFLPALFHSDVRWLAGAGLCLVTLAAWEWGNLNQLSSVRSVLLACLCLSLCIAVWVADTNFLQLLPLWSVVSFSWLVLLGFFLVKGIDRWRLTSVFFKNLVGVVLLIATWLALFQSKTIDSAYLVSVLLLVWTADISAYFAGRKWGKHKLAPAISPGKSIEGLLGALVGTVVLAVGWLLLQNRFPADISINIFAKLYSHGVFSLVFGVLFLTIVSAAGDLFESLIKRAAGMKDSSQLLPGHGGVLDRLDAILPTLPLALTLYLL